MDRASAGKLFFDALYDYRVYGNVEIRSIPDRVQTFHSPSKAFEGIKFHTGNIYFGVGLRKSSRGGDDAVCNLPALWVEFDFKDFGGSKRAAEYKIKQCPHPPSIINTSGNGYHCYWKLKGGLDIHPHNREDVKKILYGFAKFAGGDTKSTNLERILRIPGTENLKDIKNPKPVDMIYHNDRAYLIDDFKQYAGILPEKTAVTNVIHVVPDEKALAMFRYDMDKDQNLKRLWNGGKLGGDQSRSGNDFSLAMNLAFKGYTIPQIGAVLLAYEHGKARIEGARYLDYTINRAVNYAKTKSKGRW